VSLIFFKVPVSSSADATLHKAVTTAATTQSLFNMVDLLHLHQSKLIADI
jgi:hypothetical protein